MSASTARPTPAVPQRRAGVGIAAVGSGTIGIIGVVVAASVLLLLTTANPYVAAAPLLLAVGLFVFAALPMRVPLFALVFLASLSDVSRQTLPSGVVWSPPQFVLNPLLFENLNKVFPVEALRFSATDLLYTSIALVALVRVAFRIRVDSAGRAPSTNVLYVALAMAFLAAVWLELWGVGVRGGDFKQSLWQMRQLFWFPTVTALFSYCIRDARDFHRAVNLIILASCIKIAIAMRFYFAVARPAGYEPQTLTSHYDSIIFVVSVVALAIRLLHEVTWKNGLLLATVGGYILLGIVLNNRRLAFVNLLVSLFIVFIIFRGPIKKQVIRFGVLMLPFLAVYVMVGQHRGGTIFKPARLIMSVVSQKDRSSDTRDIENFNLLVTLKQQKLLGNGWGHEYIEFVRADDISKLFAQYRYIAHNSVLWMWTIGGLVGFTLLWMPICLGIFFARRAYFFARTVSDRSAAAIALTMLVTYMMQAWGDLGTQGLTSSLAATLALAASAKLAVSVGAFPARMRIVGRRPIEPVVQTVVTMSSSSLSPTAP